MTVSQRVMGKCGSGSESVGPRALGANAPARGLVVLGITLIYALCFVAIKAGLLFAPPLLFAGLRALLGGLALLMLIAAQRSSLLPERRAWGWVLGLALTTTTLAFGAMFLSPGRTGAGIAAVLANLQPVIVVALAALILGERVTRGKQAAIVLSSFGVVLLSASALAGPGAYGVSGIVLALTASVGLAVGTILAKRMGEQARLLAITAWQLILGSLPLLAASAMVERTIPVLWSVEFVGLLLFLALAGTALPTPVWYWLLQRDDAGRLSMFLFLVPAFGLGIAAAAFGEAISRIELLGVTLIVAGIGAITWDAQRIAPTPPR